MINAQFVKEPVVQRPMVLKFQRTNRMGNLFDGIFKPVGPVISRINAPLIACTVMFCMQNAVHNRIPHVHVCRCHVNLRSKDTGTLLEFTCPHLLE